MSRASSPRSSPSAPSPAPLLPCSPALAAKRRGRIAIGLLVGLATTALVLLLAVLTWPDTLELHLLDVRQRLFPRPDAHSELVTVVIDDNALAQVGRWPWPRRILAEFVNTASQAGARRIVFDITFPEPQPPEVHWPGVTDREPDAPALPVDAPPAVIDNDDLLATALRDAGNVTLPFYIRLVEDLPAETSLHDRMRTLLREDPNLPFLTAYSRLRADASASELDPLRHQYRLAWLSARAMLALERFTLPIPPDCPIAALDDPTPPIPALAAATAGAGFVSFKPDPDGVVRRLPLLGQYHGRAYPQLAFAAWAPPGLALESAHPRLLTFRDPQRDGRLHLPLDEAGNLLVRWSDSPDWGRDRPGYLNILRLLQPWDLQRAIRDRPVYLNVLRLLQPWDLQRAIRDNQAALDLADTLAFQLETVPDDLSGFDEATRRQVQALRDRLAALPEPDRLRAANAQLAADIEAARADLRRRLEGKTILLGSVATGAPDFVVTPLGASTPGVVVHQQLYDTLASRTFLRRAPRPAELAAIALLGLAMTALAARARARTVALGLLAILALTLAVNLALFAYAHLWAAIVTPLAAPLAAFTTVTFYRAVTEGRERFRITSRFKQYVSPTVVDRIVHEHAALTLAGESRRITCFFSDLAGFTTTSERLGPERTVSVLNTYLDRMTGVLDRHEATVNKFLGDGIFAFFGAPVDQPDHALRACQAALDAQRELDDLIAACQVDDPEFPHLAMRIGLSTGPVVVGDCGSHRRFDYTAIGDTVNLGARLESANKAFGSRILLCRYTRERAGDAVLTRYLGRVRVVGKEQGIPVYELLDHANRPDPDRDAWIAAFENAVELYQNAKFPQALAAFQTALTHHPNDKAALLYQQTLQSLLTNPPETFTATLDLATK